MCGQDERQTNDSKREVLRVSDCHHGGYIKKRVDIQDDELYTKTVEITECNICHQPCKVVELLVEEH